MTKAVSQALVWVNEQLGPTLLEARQALEEYIERPDNHSALSRCAERMHQVHGALQLVEVHGAALLAEEMELVSQAMLDLSGDSVRRGEGLDALTRSMVQLPAYMDRVLSGGKDIPLVLLPLLNDLRAVRGHPLLSENTILLLDLPPDRRVERETPPRQLTGESFPELAKRLRPQFQTALLHWIRGEQPDSSLAAMADIVSMLETTAVEDRSYQLWWVTGGVIEALRQNGLESAPAVKRLMGHVDLQIRLVIREGEGSLESNPPFELLNSLLFYVARSLSRGKRVTAIRNCFSLGELIPDEDALEGARDSLSAPSVKLMQTVAAAIREDLTKVKDVLDIFVRTGLQRTEDLQPQLELLKKIGDTLGVLGLGGLQRAVQNQSDELRAIADGEKIAEEADLLAVATVLIEVEDNLDSQMIGLVGEDSDAGNADSDLDEMESNRDFQEVTATVLKECILNLGLVKDAIVQSLDAPLEPQMLDEVPGHLRGITAGLLMLDRSRAVNIVERIGRSIRLWLSIGDAVPSVDALDRLADAIVSVEYYMETIQLGRSDPMYMLDNAEACLAALETMRREPDFEVAEQSPASHAETVQLPRLDAGADAGSSAPTHEKTQVMQRPGVDFELPAETPPPPPSVGPEARRIDPELLELFIEEAGELHATMIGLLPGWVENPSDERILGELRRQFHTLKGSGRMVGAERLGEFGWAIEHLLNRIIDGGVKPTPALLAFMRGAVNLVPALIEQLETGREPEHDIAAFIDQAKAFAEASPEAELMLEQTLSGREIRIMPEESARTEMDPVLREIFTKEASGHLAAIRAYLDSRDDASEPHPVTEEMHRACHTLSGSANMAGVARAVELAAPLNELVRRLFEDQAGLSAAGLTLCQKASALIGEIIDQIRDGKPITVDGGELANSLRHEYSEYVLRAEAAMEQQAAEAEAQEEEPETTQPPEAISDELSFEATSFDEDAGLAQTEAEAEAPESDLAEPLLDIDEEIAGIFCEEATELLEQAEITLNDWRQAPTEGHRLHELQRHLHTLKGGARLAGIASMGDLSHALESLVTGVAGNQVADLSAADQHIQRSLDELHRMRDLVEGGHMPSVAPDLTRALAAVTAGETVDVDTAAEAEGPPTAPEIEQEIAPDTQPVPELVSEPDAGLPAEAMPDAEVSPGIELPPAAAAPETRAIDWPVARPAPVSEPEKPELPPASEDIAAEKAAPAEPAVTPVPITAPELVEAASGLRVSSPALGRPEVARVDAELLENLLNAAGEVSIFRSRLEQQLGSVDFNLDELNQTVVRLRDQLRKLEMETEAQILNRHQDAVPRRDDFDPLELDRYSMIQQLSRALAEAANDVASLQQVLSELVRDGETLLTQQARVISELQDGLMRTRMVPFSRHAQRLSRIVRQAARENGKQAELQIQGGTSELDRQVMDRMLPPFEHLLRNAVIHGIETPEARVQKDKPEVGHIEIGLRREGSEIIVEVADDGVGLDIEAIRRRAELQGMIEPGQQLSVDAAAELILKPGFSTAVQLTQSAGRGVGMDVVATEIRDLGGSMQIETRPDKGTRFLVRLPYTRAITQALIVRCADELFALPLPTIEGVVRLPGRELARHLGERPVPYRYGDRDYHFRHLATLVDGHALPLPEDDTSIPVVLVRAGEASTALLTDEMLGAREIVVKTLGPQLAGIRGLSGATILGDGSIVVILDAGALIRSRPMLDSAYPEPVEKEHRDDRIFVMVVDDSITVRRVTERLLERNGMRVITAKDGVDAVALLQEHMPDIMLLDIEMPRMDGYEVATHVRNDPRLKHIPIVMITSRVGQKHRARAIETGVDDYLGKPYQEHQLLAAIGALVEDPMQDD
ncbi:MAG: Hpt domain-containing protein [Gammaproteobacteria bacterium]